MIDLACYKIQKILWDYGLSYISFNFNHNQKCIRESRYLASLNDIKRIILIKWNMYYQLICNIMHSTNFFGQKTFSKTPRFPPTDTAVLWRYALEDINSSELNSHCILFRWKIDVGFNLAKVLAMVTLC